jgi:hypothetical protein
VHQRRGRAIDIINVDPTKFTWSAASQTPLPGEFNGLIPLSMTQSDTQGRSYILGEPTKIVIENAAQPSVVMAMPPMHVDYIAPAGKSAPTLLNVSWAPDGFTTAYQTQETSSNQSSSTNSTSWSFGAKETFGASLSVGDIDEGNGAELKVTQKAAQALDGNIEIEHGSYSSHSFDVSQETGISDQVWLAESRFNIYVYPVIGKTVCPATKPNCQDSEKAPLTIQFSAPEQTSYETVSGDLIPWYQPSWEYGNVLSYPRVIHN